MLTYKDVLGMTRERNRDLRKRLRLYAELETNLHVVAACNELRQLLAARSKKILDALRSIE